MDAPKPTQSAAVSEKGAHRRPKAASYPRLTREQLLSCSDIKHPSESYLAKLERGEVTSSATAEVIGKAVPKAHAILRSKAARILIAEGPNLFRAFDAAHEAKQHSEGRRRLANRVQSGHTARRGDNARPKGSRRAGPSSTTSSSDPGEPSEPEPRLCLCGCGADISDQRADAEFFSDTHSKRYRRKVRQQELLAPETSWAAAERNERADWAELGDRRREDRIHRPALVEDDVDPDGLLQSLMEGYFDRGDDGHLHPLTELRPEAAKRKKLAGDWSRAVAA